MGPHFTFLLSNPEQIVGESGVEYHLPFWMWRYLPKANNDQHLLGFYNALVVPAADTSYHSRRNYPLFLRPKYRLMRGVLSENIKEIDFCLDVLKVDINDELDEYDERGFTAASLAAKYDKLEALHYLDMRGADLNRPDSLEGNTPLMNAVINWQS